MVPSQEAIACRAQELWEEAGCPPDLTQRFWNLAEEELESRFYAEEDEKPLPDRAENDTASAAFKIMKGADGFRSPTPADGTK